MPNGPFLYADQLLSVLTAKSEQGGFKDLVIYVVRCMCSSKSYDIFILCDVAVSISQTHPECLTVSLRATNLAHKHVHATSCKQPGSVLKIFRHPTPWLQAPAWKNTRKQCLSYISLHGTFDGDLGVRLCVILHRLSGLFPWGFYFKFKGYLLLQEACESGSIFEGLLSDSLNIYATTASNAVESSWGTYCPGMEPSPPPEFNTCLGDLYSVAFLENRCFPSVCAVEITAATPW